MAPTGKAGGGQVLCNSQVPSGLQMFAGVGTGRRVSFIYLLYSPLISFLKKGLVFIVLSPYKPYEITICNSAFNAVAILDNVLIEGFATTRSIFEISD